MPEHSCTPAKPQHPKAAPSTNLHGLPRLVACAPGVRPADRRARDDFSDRAHIDARAALASTVADTVKARSIDYARDAATACVDAAFGEATSEAVTPAGAKVDGWPGQFDAGPLSGVGVPPAYSVIAHRKESSIWITGQVCSRDQRKGRYIPESIYHPGKMLPSIARQAIAEYTAPGDIVADPMCGIGTTLIEAMHSGRIGIGVEYEKRWAELGNRNIEHATNQDASGKAMLWHGDGRDIGRYIPAKMRGQVALVITSPPYGPSTHGRAYTGNRRVGRKVLKAHHKYGEDRDNLAYAGASELAAGFTDILAACAPILRPGGIVAVTARPYRHRGELVDIPGMVIAAGYAAGLRLIDRKAALLCGVRDGHLVPRGSFFQIKNARQAEEQGSTPLHVVQHEDLLLFSAGGAR